MNRETRIQKLEDQLNNQLAEFTEEEAKFIQEKILKRIPPDNILTTIFKNRQFFPFERNEIKREIKVLKAFLKLLPLQTQKKIKEKVLMRLNEQTNRGNA